MKVQQHKTYERKPANFTFFSKATSPALRLSRSLMVKPVVFRNKTYTVQFSSSQPLSLTRLRRFLVDLLLPPASAALEEP